MSQTYCQLARELSIPENQLTSIIQRAGISCDSEFNGNFIWLIDDIGIVSKNRILLHTNSFGEFPIVALPAVNMLETSDSAREIINNFGIDTIALAVTKTIPSILNPGLSNRELFSLAYFLANLWVDIKQETYRHRYVYWNPLISFETPVYYRQGNHIQWDINCNILRANILEIIDSIYRFLLWSFDDYSYKGAKYLPTKFPMTLAKKEDLSDMPGIACLSTTNVKQQAYRILTLIRQKVAQMCCMLLRRGNETFVIDSTTDKTFFDDIKQLYLLIQKMEAFINNG